jgi:hypothetical protein
MNPNGQACSTSGAASIGHQSSPAQTSATGNSRSSIAVTTAKLATAAAQRPEQVGLVVRVGADQSPVRRDDDEYRAITRQTIIRGLAGTSTPGAITVTLHQPDVPRVTRALDLLIEEINNNPPAMPGDPRPITYRLANRPA